ncbi:DUF3515 domain-containing protein [Streptomyces sp. DSM 44917]|uniref:DUF3515 domain-containing protein n=1 Tax=Streptomyces boetiae TaxID=3075541 RepID=A0ABU2L9J7_9ACTN|nr:DUF3515 domain-containing protein [Streptomyces sp. DSM 44917]MDT0308229.1 DUF3515 domain-containing protein [Streptomyces sp. DSM 44917]
MIDFARRVPLLAVPLAALCGAACAGGSPGGQEIPAPSPSGEAVRACRALAGELPDRVDGEQRQGRGELPEFTAAWGDPRIALRCGVPRPPVLTPGDDAYNPFPDIVGINGVDWLVEERDAEVRFTTTGRTVFVELTVPDDYAPEVNPLLDLATPIDAHIPLDALWETPSPETPEESDSPEEPGESAAPGASG